MAKYVVGDIHGNLKALKQVLKEAPLKKGDTVIFLGDYGDGFPDTSEVVDTLLAMKGKYKCIFLLGNHDVWIQSWFNVGTRPVIWTEQGGDATIDSYIESMKFHDADHKEFWNSLKTFYIDEDNNLFVHAGWNPSKPFLDAADKVVHTDSGDHPDIVWDRTLINYINKKIENKHTKEFNQIFIGHTAVGLMPIMHRNMTAIDTGAGWDGKLTIMDVDTGDYWQSDKNERSGR